MALSFFSDEPKWCVIESLKYAPADLWVLCQTTVWAKIAKKCLQEFKNPYNEHRSIAMRLRQNMLTMLAQVVELVDTLL